MMRCAGSTWKRLCSWRKPRPYFLIKLWNPDELISATAAPSAEPKGPPAPVRQSSQAAPAKEEKPDDNPFAGLFASCASSGSLLTPIMFPHVLSRILHWSFQEGLPEHGKSICLHLTLMCSEFWPPENVRGV